MTKDFEVKNNFIRAILVIVSLNLLILGTGIAIGFIFLDPNNVTFLWWFVGILVVLFMTVPYYVGLKMMNIVALPPQPFTSKKETLKEVLSKNSSDYPFEVVDDNNFDLLLRFKLADESWKQFLYKSKFSETYVLYIKLDEAKRVAYFCEKTHTVSWSMGLDRTKLFAKINFSFFTGIIFSDWSRLRIYDGFQDLKLVGNADYNIDDVKFPVFNILLKNGWTLKPRILSSLVRK